MDRAWLRAVVIVCAEVMIGCGAGDHENANLKYLFGRATGGSKAPSQSSAGADVGAVASPVPSLGASAPTASAAAVSGGVAGADALWSATAGNGVGRGQGQGPAGGANASASTTGVAGATQATAGSDAMPFAAGNAAMTGACNPGYLTVAGQCVCDLNGTFAYHGRAQATLQGTAPVESLNETIELWGIVHHQYDVQGNLGLTLSACGQTTPDICTAAQPPLLPTAEAYAQYVPVGLWDKPITPAALRMSLPGAVPGAPFASPAMAQLFGVTLADPLGAWPGTRKDVEGGTDFDGSAVNGAQWVDVDGDGQLGLTTMVVPPGGVAANATNGPLQSYGATSTACPRTDPGAARSSYAYLPMPQGLGVKRLKRLYAAQRVILEFHGTLDTCDRISGMLTGPNGGKLQMNALFGGCALVNGSGESACGAALLDAVDSGGGATMAQELGSGSFVLTRVKDDVTCAEVRAMKVD